MQICTICQQIACGALHDLRFELVEFSAALILTLTLLVELSCGTATNTSIAEFSIVTPTSFIALLALIKRASSLLHPILRVKAVVILTIKELIFGHFQSLLLFICNIYLHDVESELILDVLTNVVSILTMAITNTKVPQILDLGEVFDNKEVVLVCFSHTVSGLA